MFKIGDFSKLSQVSAKALRYYDKVGLLKPAHIDKFTAYRYYTIDQLPRINRILALRDLGFSLEQIGKILDEGLSAEQIRGMMRLRQAEVQQEMQDARLRMEQIESRLRQIEREGCLPKYDVIMKKIDPLLVASIRDVIPLLTDQWLLWSELFTHLKQGAVKFENPILSVYHDPEYMERDWDIEVCVPLQSPISENERVHVRNLPAVENMACVVHHGPVKDISAAYQVLIQWIEENNYLINGPGRELSYGFPDDLNTIFEIQFPIEALDKHPPG